MKKEKRETIRIAERVIEKLIRQQVHIDKMSLVFTPGCRPTNKIAILIQLQEIYLQKKKNLYFAFKDLEKAFDRVPRDVVL